MQGRRRRGACGKHEIVKGPDFTHQFVDLHLQRLHMAGLDGGSGLFRFPRGR